MNRPYIKGERSLWTDGAGNPEDWNTKHPPLTASERERRTAVPLQVLRKVWLIKPGCLRQFGTGMFTDSETDLIVPSKQNEVLNEAENRVLHSFTKLEVIRDYYILYVITVGLFVSSL